MQISINQKFNAILGILESERTQEQLIYVDTIINYEYTKSEKFLDYSLIATDIKDHIQIKEYKLLESALEETIEMLLQKYIDIKNIDMKISKPDIIDDAVVSMRLEKENLYSNYFEFVI